MPDLSRYSRSLYDDMEINVLRYFAATGSKKMQRMAKRELFNLELEDRKRKRRGKERFQTMKKNVIIAAIGVAIYLLAGGDTSWLTEIGKAILVAIKATP